MNMIEQYLDGSLKGWPGQEQAEAEYAQIKSTANFLENVAMSLPAGAPRYSSNYLTYRKLFNKDLVNIAQEVGDCVSWGARNASAITGASDILMRGERETWKDPFPPFYYGTGRVLIGGGRLGTSDGSLGSWMASAVMKYGTVYFGDEGVPKYSGELARQYGYYGPPNELLTVGKAFLIKSAVRVKTWDELVTFLVSGYGVTIASDRGFEMEPDRDGFHRPKGVWQHQMCFADIDDEWTRPYVITRNSWANVHGQLKDFRTNEPLPVGCLRVDRKVVEYMLSSGEAYAYTQYEQPKAQDIREALFKVV
jgi:hypothetical protein